TRRSRATLMHRTWVTPRHSWRHRWPRPSPAPPCTSTTAITAWPWRSRLPDSRRTRLRTARNERATGRHHRRLAGRTGGGGGCLWRTRPAGPDERGGPGHLRDRRPLPDVPRPGIAGRGVAVGSRRRPGRTRRLGLHCRHPDLLRVALPDG